MKKPLLIMTTLTIMSPYTVFSGSMGPLNTPKASSFYYYTGAEASVTWNKFQPTDYNNIVAQSTKQPWGGRFLAGLANNYSQNIALMAEIGGGYYGSFNQSAPILGASARTVLDGYDFLVGGAYEINKIDLFGQVGLMVQNMRTKVTQNFATQIPGGVYSGIKTSIFSQTEALPEIKVGVMYALTENWKFSVAYMHVFGANVYNNTMEKITPDAVIESGSLNSQNPTLNSVLFGVRYNFI